MATNPSIDLTRYDDDNLLTRVDILRAQLNREHEPDVRQFIGVLLAEAIAECRRRYLQRTAETAAEQCS